MAGGFLIAFATYGILVLRPIQSPFTYWHGISFSASLCFVIVADVALNLVPWVTDMLDLPPIKWVGRRSYGIYLWHYPVLALFAASFGDTHWVKLGGVALSFLLAGLSYRYIETPFLKLKPAPRSVAANHANRKGQA